MIQLDMNNIDFILVVGLVMTILFFVASFFFKNDRAEQEAVGKVLFGVASIIMFIVTAIYQAFGKS